MTETIFTGVVTTIIGGILMIYIERYINGRSGQEERTFGNKTSYSLPKEKIFVPIPDRGITTVILTLLGWSFFILFGFYIAENFMGTPVAQTKNIHFIIAIPGLIATTFCGAWLKNRKADFFKWERILYYILLAMAIGFGLLQIERGITGSEGPIGMILTPVLLYFLVIKD